MKKVVMMMNRMFFLLLSISTVSLHGMDTERFATEKIVIAEDVVKQIGSVQTMQVIDSMGQYPSFCFINDKNNFYSYEVKNVENLPNITTSSLSSNKNNVVFIGTPFNMLVKNKNRTIIDFFNGSYSGDLQNCIPSVVRTKDSYKVVGMWGENEHHFFTHNTPVNQLYGINYIREWTSYEGKEELESGDEESQKHVVLISGSAFPSVYIYHQLQHDNNTFKEEVKKFPGYYLLAVGDNKIVYAKHPTKTSFIGRFFSDSAQKNVLCKVYIKDIINDKDGSLCDLNDIDDKGSIGETLIPAAGCMQGVITPLYPSSSQQYALWKDNVGFVTYDLIKNKINKISYENDLASSLFVMKYSLGNMRLVWFVKNKNAALDVCYMHLNDRTIEQKPLQHKNVSAGTYSSSMEAFYYISKDENETSIVKVAKNALT